MSDALFDSPEVGPTLATRPPTSGTTPGAAPTILDPTAAPGHHVPDRVQARFWSCVHRTDNCWLWTKPLYHGYGRFWMNGRNLGAHRVAYELLIGPIPEGLELDHLCHTRDTACPGGVTCLHRRCVNPEHLEPVTNLENMLRSRTCVTMVYSRQTHCKRGHPLSGPNLYLARGRRYCRECRSLRARLPGSHGRFGPFPKRRGRRWISSYGRGGIGIYVGSYGTFCEALHALSDAQGAPQ